MQVSRQQIEKTFGMPLHQAALVLNCSIEDLRAQCRTLGIKRWPFRKRSASFPRRSSIVITNHGLYSETSVEGSMPLSAVKVIVTQTKQIPQLFNHFSVLPEPNHETRWFSENFSKEEQKDQKPYSKLQSKFNIHKIGGNQASENVPKRQAQAETQTIVTIDEFDYDAFDGSGAQDDYDMNSNRKRRVYQVYDKLSPANKVAKKVERSFHPITIAQVSPASLKHQTRVHSQETVMQQLPPATAVVDAPPQQPMFLDRPVATRRNINPVNLNSTTQVLHSTILQFPELDRVHSSNSSTPNLSDPIEAESSPLPPISALFKQVAESQKAAAIKKQHSMEPACVTLPSIRELMSVKPQKFDAVGL